MKIQLSIFPQFFKLRFVNELNSDQVKSTKETGFMFLIELVK